MGKIKCIFHYGGLQPFYPHIYIHSDGKLTVSLHMVLGRMLSRFSSGVIGDKDNFREKSTKFHVMQGTIFRSVIFFAQLQYQSEHFKRVSTDAHFFVPVEKKRQLDLLVAQWECLKVQSFLASSENISPLQGIYMQPGLSSYQSQTLFHHIFGKGFDPFLCIYDLQ